MRIIGRLAPYLLLAPSFVLFAAVFAYPWANSLILSFEYWNLSGQALPLGTFIGLANWAKMFADPLFGLAILHTGVFSVLSVAFNLAIGLGMAIIFTRGKTFTGARWIRTIYLIPFLSSPIIDGLAWKLLLQENLGLVNSLLRLVGISAVGWSSDPNVVLWTVLLVDIWAQTPWIILVFSAGLLAIPAPQYEAARIDGASRWNQFRYVTVPWLWPLIILVIIFRLTGALRTYGIVFVAIGEQGGPNHAMLLLSNLLNTEIFRFYDFGVRSALSWFLLVLTFILSFALILTLYREIKI